MTRNLFDSGLGDVFGDDYVSDMDDEREEVDDDQYVEGTVVSSMNERRSLPAKYRAKGIVSMLITKSNGKKILLT